MIAPMEVEFQKIALEEIKAENKREGGLLFPFLRACHIPGRPWLRAIRIPSTKPPYFACFACLSRTAKEKRYNGIFFTVDTELLYAEGYVEVDYVRIPAIIKADEVLDVEGEVIDVKIYVEMDLDAVEEFFKRSEAIYVKDRNDLSLDVLL